MNSFTDEKGIRSVGSLATITITGSRGDVYLDSLSQHLSLLLEGSHHFPALRLRSLDERGSRISRADVSGYAIVKSHHDRSHLSMLVPVVLRLSSYS